MAETLAPVQRGDPNRAADPAVGLVFMILGAGLVVAGILMQALIASIMGGFPGLGGPSFRLSANGGAVYTGSSNNLPNLILSVLVSYCLLLFAAGFGISRSKAWGFNMGIVLCSLMILSGSGWAVFGLASAVYCVFGRISISRSEA